MPVTGHSEQGVMRMLGEYVRTRREALGLNQEEIAAAIGRNQRYISRLENEMKDLPEPDMMRAIAVVLRCTVGDLLTAAGYLSVDDESRFAAMRETSQIYETERRLEQLRGSVDEILGMVREMRDERGVIVTDGSR